MWSLCTFMNKFKKFIFSLFSWSDESDSLKSHPLQLDSINASGSLCTLGAVSNDLKTGVRAQDSTSGGSGSHGVCLTLNDHDRIRQFIQEFTFRGLLPHIEKNIRQLNDQVKIHVRVGKIQKLSLLLVMSLRHMFNFFKWEPHSETTNTEINLLRV